MSVVKTTLIGAMAALLLVGCGGGGGSNVGRGEVSGVVFDADGKPVRGATVFVDADGHRETETDSAGTYVLRGVAAKDVLVRAETPDGQFVGQNLARVFTNERDLSVNIALYRSNNLARIVGQVTDGSGNVQRGLRVFARPTDDSILSSSSAVTDNDGFYVIDRLARGVEYRVLATAPNRGEDTRLLTPTAREVQQNLVLGTASNPDLTAPTGLDAIAYTTPGQDTFRSTKLNRAFEAVKRQLDPTRAARMAKRPTTKDTALGRPIEVDLFWDEYTKVDTYGFGVYRRALPSTVDISTFLHDPLAQYFADGDELLQPNVEYSYAITAISTTFNEGTGQGQSPLSNRISVVPLSDLLLQSPTGQTVRWTPVAGAAKYQMFVYEEYPDVGILPIHTSAELSGAASSYAVPGTLTPGRTYYYVVVGSRADNSAQALSIVGTL
ncbi:carboxypeptidase regulatory-like domain-containing protein [bacterium]|nr:MAG: carboxypeptidase regulatory-like domain-containing protein [bacterium]